MKQARGGTLDKPMGMEIRRLAQVLEGRRTLRLRILLVRRGKKEGETPGKGCLFGLEREGICFGDGLALELVE